MDLHKPVMFVGGAGVGKTQLVKGKLAGLNPETFMAANIAFNYFTDVVSFQKVGGLVVVVPPAGGWRVSSAVARRSSGGGASHASVVKRLQ